ncbi:ester cyclase [Sorangium sp. So ce367]|uniref:ester cyclase n=1 Tax=Sorangium sp. So ce367 TaxID=3133305 RepID=UPI003F64503C
MSKDLAEKARRALERVCSGSGLEPASRYYSPSFVDHVNDLEFRGHAGVERSVTLYRSLLTDMSISVEDQVVEGDRVTSRFVISGTSHGRPVRFSGITISRFENGLIVEDWSVTDMLGLLRQLGFARSLLIGAKSLRSLIAASRSGHATKTTPRS